MLFSFVSCFLSAAETSLQLVEKTGLQGGIIFLPQTDNAGMAVELAKKLPFIVYAQCADTKQVNNIKEKAIAENLLARKLYADTGDASHLPLAPHSATIVLVDNLENSGINAKNLNAWVSALSPLRGIAILGNHDAKKVDCRKLMAALDKCDGVKVKKLVDGFVSCRKQALPGTEPWPQKFHDASNLRSTGDATLKPPFLPAWYALPTNLGYWGDTMISIDGRGYYIWANRAHTTPVSMICFDLRNGAKLWEHFFKWDKPRDKNQGGYYPGRSCMLAKNNDLYFIDEAVVRQLDGESGREKGAIPGPKPDGQIKWIGEEGDILAMLDGDPDKYSTSSLQQHSINPHGTELAAFDLKTKKQLWKATETGQIDERELAIRDSKLYYHALNQRVVCRDLKTGKILWENKDAEVLKLLAERKTDKIHDLLISCRILAATPKVLYFASALLKNRIALDCKNGKLLWSEPITVSPGRALPDVIHGDTVYRSIGDKQWSGAKFDLITNKKLSDKRAPGSGCGPSYSGPDYFVTAFGGIHQLDGKMLRNGDLKSACEIGTVIADGVAFNAAGICRCDLEIHGFRAFTWGENKNQGVPPAMQPGPAISVKLGENAGSKDWPVYRQNNQRSGSTKVAVANSAPKLIWSWQPQFKNEVIIPPTGYGARYLDQPEYLPSQAISVGDMVYFADHQNVVRAVALADGKEKWSYPVGAKLLIPPAYAQGRIVTGTVDGYVRCIDAKTGKLAWQYRVPPQDRRIMWYGHLVSTWPITGGVLIENGIVYAVAGFQSGYGIYAAALNLASGKPVWTKYVPPAENPDQSLGSMGCLAAAKGKVFFPTGSIVPGAFDMKTGSVTTVAPVRFAGTGRRGKDIAALSDDWLVYGGSRTYADFNRWIEQDRGIGYTICKTDLTVPKETGKRVCLGADFVEPSMLLPLSDDQLIVAASEYQPFRGNPVLQAWEKKKLLAAAAKLDSPKGGQRKYLDKRVNYFFSTLRERNKDRIPSGGIWQDVQLPVFAAALCQNALVVIHPKDGKRNELKNWQLAALDRKTGKAIWTIDLPGRPAWNSLSVAADSSILMAMWDGSVLCYK